MTFKEEVQREADKLASEVQIKYRALLDNRKCTAIINSVAMSAAEAKLSAAYNGSHTDGGASSLISKLEAFLDGILYAKTGDTLTYAKLLQDILKLDDPQYKEYLRLKKLYS